MRLRQLLISTNGITSTLLLFLQALGNYGLFEYKALHPQLLLSVNDFLSDPLQETAQAEFDLAETRLFSFGYLPLMIDWLLIDAIVHFENRVVKTSEHTSFYWTLKKIIGCDSAYFDAYHIAGNFLAVIQKDGAGARNLLLKGREFIQKELDHQDPVFVKNYWSEPWRISFLLAYVDLFLFNNLEEAGVDFKEASSYEGAPSYLKSLSQRFYEPGGKYKVGSRLLNFFIQTEKNQEELALLKKRQKDLSVAYYLYELNDTFSKLLKERFSVQIKYPITLKQLNELFQFYLKQNRLSSQDPWGGTLSVNAEGRIVSSTVYEPVFGLE